MKTYAFTLDNKHKTRCPQCGRHKRFTPYVRTATGEAVDAEVCGRCDRIYHCGYSMSPREYFEKHPDNSFTYKSDKTFKSTTMKKRPKVDYNAIANEILANRRLSSLPKSNNTVVDNTLWGEAFKNSMQRPADNNPLCAYFRRVFGDDELTRNIIGRVMTFYNVGTSKLWGGSALLWMTDYNGSIVDGKIMAFDAVTGKRIKNPQPLITWTSAKMPSEASSGVRYDYKPMFGEHLLRLYPDAVALVVESEKTALSLAIMMTLFFGQDIFKKYLPVAVCSVSGLNSRNIDTLLNFVANGSGKTLTAGIRLIPDRGCYDKWRRKCAEMRVRSEFPHFISVSEVMEGYFADSDIVIADGDDIHDIIAQIMPTPHNDLAVAGLWSALTSGESGGAYSLM